jgi:TnpA family transposase
MNRPNRAVRPTGLTALSHFGAGVTLGRRPPTSHGHSEDGIRYVRRRYLSPQAAQSIEIANATFAARDHALWRAGTTAVASDSPHSARVQRPVAVPVLGMDDWPSRGHGSRTSGAEG